MSLDRLTLRQVPLTDVPLEALGQDESPDTLILAVAPWIHLSETGAGLVMRALVRHDLPPLILALDVDAPLNVAYQVGYDLGAYLLELDGASQPVRAYHRGQPT